MGYEPFIELWGTAVTSGEQITGFHAGALG